MDNCPRPRFSEPPARLRSRNQHPRGGESGFTGPRELKSQRAAIGDGAGRGRRALSVFAASQHPRRLLQGRLVGKLPAPSRFWGVQAAGLADPPSLPLAQNAPPPPDPAALGHLKNRPKQHLFYKSRVPNRHKAEEGAVSEKPPLDSPTPREASL
ncbi:variable charge X-linked protein 3B [Meriones unguiculatus]|uniref:variable charge X-linked protein 3B n=1 Tax=Meriones unguiculatus TaxID=10047 RepID=UPI00293EE6A8|nr:variable charge X-linked protein 3B [Meriones unguiculatus]